MDDKRVGTDHFHRAHCFVPAITEVELGCAKVRHERNGGGEIAQTTPKPGAAIRINRNTLRADCESDSQLFTGRREIRIDKFCARRPAGHGTDQKRGAYMSSEELCSKFDFI